MTTKRKSLILEKEIIEKVESSAKKEGRSFSNMVERILRHYLEKSGRT